MRSAAALAALALAGLVVTGCDQQTVDKTQQELNRAIDKTQSAVGDPVKAAQDAAQQALGTAAGEAQKGLDAVRQGLEQLKQQGDAALQKPTPEAPKN